MKKINYLLIIGIFFIFLSILLFSFWREDVTPSCINSITCGTAVSYFDSLDIFRMCLMYCETNTNNITFNIPNQNFVIFVWLGILFIGLWIIIQLGLFTIKIFKKLV
jgi:hypothetical protein